MDLFIVPIWIRVGTLSHIKHVSECCGHVLFSFKPDHPLGVTLIGLLRTQLACEKLAGYLGVTSIFRFLDSLNRPLTTSTFLG